MSEAASCRHAHCSIVIPLGFRGMLSQKTFQESDISGITRFEMNCQSCNTTIDYRFQTNCAHCETDQPSLLVAPIEAPIASVEKRFTWTRRVVNLMYLLTISAAAMVSSALVLYCGSAIIYAHFLRNTVNTSHSCGGTGEAIAAFSILTGAFLGTVAGSVLATKNPVWK